MIEFKVPLLSEKLVYKMNKWVIDKNKKKLVD